MKKTFEEFATKVASYTVKLRDEAIEKAADYVISKSKLYADTLNLTKSLADELARLGGITMMVSHTVQTHQDAIRQIAYLMRGASEVHARVGTNTALPDINKDKSVVKPN